MLGFIIGVPAAWAILLLFHPLGGDSFYETIDGNVTAWITVHLGMGVFVPLFGESSICCCEACKAPRPH